MVRIKERYLLVNILYPPETSRKSGLPDCIVYHQPTSAALSPGALLRGVRAEVAALFGDYGAGSIESGLSVKYLSHATSTFIIRVSRNHHRLVWAALTCMNRVPCKNGKRCVFRVLRVSGTIRKVEEEAIRAAKRLHLMASQHVSGPSPLEALRPTRQQQKDTDKLDVGGDDDEGGASDVSWD